MTAKPLWTPSPERIASHRLSRFIGMVTERHGLELSGWGVRLGKDYPEPVISHSDGRERALAAFARLKERKG